MVVYSLPFGYAIEHDDDVPPPRPVVAGEAVERLTVTLPSPLRDRLELLAAREGVSAETVAARALARSLESAAVAH